MQTLNGTNYFHSKWFAMVCLSASMLLVGCYVAMSKPLTLAFPILLLAWLRFAIGAIAMVPWLRKPADEPPLDKRTHWLLFWQGVLGHFLFTLCMLFGVQITGAAQAGVTMAAIPAVVALMGWLFLREHVAARIWAAVGCAVLGIGVFAAAGQTPRSAEDTAVPWLGGVLLVVAVLCEASYSIIGKKLTATVGPKRIAALINLWGLALTTPLGLYAAPDMNWTGVDWQMWLLLVLYALAACQWSAWLWMTGLRTLPAAQSGVFTVLLPISAAGIGVVWLGETLSGVQWAGFLLALVSIALASWPSGRR
jgi:drug/metabolite transporter (DMT)-like permease